MGKQAKGVEFAEAKRKASSSELAELARKQERVQPAVLRRRQEIAAKILAVKQATVEKIKEKEATWIRTAGSWTSKAKRKIEAKVKLDEEADKQDAAKKAKKEERRLQKRRKR